MPPIDESELTAQEREVYNTLTYGQKNIFLQLSEEVRRLIGRRAPANACPPDQRADGVCLWDKRVTSQPGVRKPTNWDELSPDAKFSDRISRWRIKDALKGSLLLSPGGPSGIIGAMLAALRPPQDYSHMGIVVEDDGFDGTMLRHCTTSEDWLNSKLFTTGKVFAGTELEQSIPLRGFRSDAMKYLWPGTISQTVEVAYKGQRDGVFGDEVYLTDGAGNTVWEDDEFGKKQKILRDKYAVLDPIRPNDDRGTGKRFRISALTFESVFIPANGDVEARWVHPLIVQPCIHKRTPAVRQALRRISEATQSLRGHYRFFSYTDATVAGMPDGPTMLEELGEPFCIGGKMITEPVAQTRGMMCASLIWQAVQVANSGTEPKILLDGRPERREPDPRRSEACWALAANLGRQRRLPASEQRLQDPLDGLYFYSAANRQGAALAVRDALVERVMGNIKGVLDDVTGPPVLGALEGALASLPLTYVLSWHPAILAVVLGVSKAYLDGEVDKVRKTAVHLSNQMGDTFRKDNSALDNEDDDWKNNPGDGHTVSPDDTLNSWAAPYFENETTVAGVYGSSIVAQVLSPAPIAGEWKPSTWEISTDEVRQPVRVFRRGTNGNPIYLAGATVRLGCAEKVTRDQARMEEYQFIHPVPTGQFFVGAKWTDPATGFTWYSPRSIVSIPDERGIDIEVFSPAQTRRHLKISGTADLLNRHVTDEIPIIGTDPWEASVGFDSSWIPMGVDFKTVTPSGDPEFDAWIEANHGSDLKGIEKRVWPLDFQIEDWGIVRVLFTCSVDDSGTVSVTVKGGTREGSNAWDNTEPDWGAEQGPFPIAPKSSNGDPGFTFNLKVERTGFAVPPVRAFLKITIDNNQQSG